MRLFACALVVGLMGCAGVQVPTPGWMVGKTTHQTVCFREPGGVGHWETCDYLDGDDKLQCQVNALTLHGGEVFAPKTKLALFGHMMNGESQVRVLNGEYSNTTFYCPTTHIRKF